MKDRVQQLKDLHPKGTVYGIDKDGDEFAIIPDQSPESYEYSGVLAAGKLFWIHLNDDGLFESIEAGYAGRDEASRFPGARMISAEQMVHRMIDRQA